MLGSATCAALLRRGDVRGWRRGVVMLEFAMILPALVFTLLFTVDMGRMVLLQSALQDATQQAARAGAQVGGAGNGSTGTSRVAFNGAIDAAPGMTRSRVSSFVVNDGFRCRVGESYVEVTTRYRADFVTPGLTSVLGIFAGEDRDPASDWTLEATSVARCEVAR